MKLPALAIVLVLLFAGCVGRSPQPVTQASAKPAPTPTTAAAQDAPRRDPSPAPATTAPKNNTSPPASNASAPAAPTPAAPPGPIVETRDFSDSITTPGSPPAYNFTIRPGATAIHAVLWWNGTASDVALSLEAPGWCGSNATDPAGGAMAVKCEAPHQAEGTSGDGYFAQGGAASKSPLVVDIKDKDLAPYACKADRCAWTLAVATRVADGLSYHARVAVTYAAAAA